MSGTPSRTARVSTARWNLKEAEDKTPIRGTQILYEATVCGRGSVGSQTQRHPERAGVYKAEMERRSHALPWEICPWATLLGRSRGQPIKGQKSAEGIVGRCSDQRPELVRAERTNTSMTAEGRSNED